MYGAFFPLFLKIFKIQIFSSTIYQAKIKWYIAFIVKKCSAALLQTTNHQDNPS